MLRVEVILLLLNIVVLCQASTLENVNKLHTDLLTGYNKYVRPADITEDPVYVSITFYLVGIQDFNEVTGKFSVTGFMIVTWKDSRMTWNPPAYNLTYYIPVAGNLVWRPNIILVNPFGSVDKIGQDFMEIRYVFNGDASWPPGDVFSSSCSIDVTYYPFDTQTCELRMMNWGAPDTEVTLLSAKSHVDVTFYSTHGTWDLITTKTEAVSGGGMSYFSVRITIKRRPLFFLVNVVLPILFMAFLNSLVFILPVESGERVSYAITVLLAIAVFLTLVGDNLPKTSEPMSVLCYFLLTDLVMSAVVSILTILGLRIYYIDEARPVPKWLCWVVVCLSCGSNRKRKSAERVTPSPDTLSKPNLKFDNVLDKDPTQSKKTRPSKHQVTTVMRVKTWQSDVSVFDEKQEDNPIADVNEPHVRWKHVANALDKISFVACMVWMIVMCITYFAYTTRS